MAHVVGEALPQEAGKLLKGGRTVVLGTVAEDDQSLAQAIPLEKLA